MIKRFASLALALALGGAGIAHAAPKKLLVVTVTTGFRHSSIETAERVLKQIGETSGAFTVDYVHQPEGQPKNPGKPPVRNEKKDTDESFAQKTADYSKALAEFNTANKAWGEKIKAYMAENMTLEKLKAYDGYVFANTTGDLLIPDREGFINLIREGRAFIAMHSGSDTYHPFRGYVDMLGGEFETHKAQVEIQPIVHDRQHPATKPFPADWKVFDEIYIIKSYDPKRVKQLLGLDAHPNDKTPGYFPVSWTREEGQGRVFYTSLGHREDVWDPEWKAGTPDRKNTPEIAKTYQAHILGGIQWALKAE